MRGSLLLPSLMFAAVTAGCGPVVVVDTVPTGTPAYFVDPGAGLAGIDPGHSTAYFITANSGGSFRMVWTGDYLETGAARHMAGSIWTVGGFGDVAPGCIDGSCPLEPGSGVSGVVAVRGGSRIDFDTFSTTSAQGLDFIADPSEESATFAMFVDGAARPDLVLFSAGGAVSSPEAIPFTLSLP